MVPAWAKNRARWAQSLKAIVTGQLPLISFLTLLLFLTPSILITRVATVALTYTGLSRESAKFQARLAFT